MWRGSGLTPRWGASRKKRAVCRCSLRSTHSVASSGRDQLTLPTQARKRLECERQILACVSSGQHDAQACCVAWHGGKGDGLHKDAGIEQLGTQEFGALGIADHDGGNGRLRVPQVKAKGLHALLKKVGIVPQLRNLVLGLLEQFPGNNAGGHIRGGGRAGKQVRPGALLEIIDEYLTSSDVAANDPKRLRERPRLDIDLAE